MHRPICGYIFERAAMAVVLQVQIDSASSGVCFSVNPLGDSNNSLVEGRVDFYLRVSLIVTDIFKCSGVFGEGQGIVVCMNILCGDKDVLIVSILFYFYYDAGWFHCSRHVDGI